MKRFLVIFIVGFSWFTLSHASIDYRNQDKDRLLLLQSIADQLVGRVGYSGMIKPDSFGNLYFDVYLDNSNSLKQIKRTFPRDLVIDGVKLRYQVTGEYEHH